jgi:hypothetical protein
MCRISGGKDNPVSVQHFHNSSQYAQDLEETLSTLRAELQSEGQTAQRSNLIVLPATLKIAGKVLPTYAITDTGAEGKGFIDQSWATSPRLPSRKLERPIGLEVFDGREAESGRLTEYVTAWMRIEDHYKEIRLYVTQFAHYPVILGMPWMK